MNTTRRAAFAAAVLGAGLGGFAVTSAMSGSADQPSAQTVPIEINVDPGPFAATTGDEPALFSYSVSNLHSTETVQVVSIDARGVTMNINFQGGTATGTFADAFTIQSGLSYSAMGQEDGTVFVVGIVPDEVDTVLVNGEAAELHGNLWTTTLPGWNLVELRVGDATSDRWVTL